MCLCVKIRQIYGESVWGWVYEQLDSWQLSFLSVLILEPLVISLETGGCEADQGKNRPNWSACPSTGPERKINREKEKKKEKQKETEKRTQEDRGTQNKTIIVFCPHFFFPSLLSCKLIEVHTHMHTRSQIETVSEKGWENAWARKHHVQSKRRTES